MAYSDRELLARIVECEAGGEGDAGMRAVASVVMNRVQITYGEYGRLYTLREVVYQKYQFTCAMETVGGAYNPQNLYNMRPTQVHYDIADWAWQATACRAWASPCGFTTLPAHLPGQLSLRRGTVRPAPGRPLFLRL